ncbi:diguanylate cyclase [Amycolatopsis albispora]|uniref:Diguanylate cyclase n=1 Tax=Amycolatopsis albispora TaxID=1804986 RepID=A0A344LJQ6_9PSEU|nr:diguanylate cyclase [Amycolatopsis albispora]
MAVSFAFQPLYSLHTGGAVALEALARAGAGEHSVARLLDDAARAGRLAETDVALAAHAVRQEADGGSAETLLPLHLNLSAASVAEGAQRFTPLLDVLDEVGRRPREVVLEIGPPFSRVRPADLLESMAALTDLGFRLALDGLGRGDLPLALLAAAPVSTLKVDGTLIARSPNSPNDTATAAVFESLLHFASRTGARLVATGIENTQHFEVVRGLGIRVAQGPLFTGTEQGGWLDGVTAPLPITAGPAMPSAAPGVKDFLKPATTLPATATCEDVREALASTERATGIVGVDERERPLWSVDRARFLLAFTGPYGHALHAKRSADRLADTPHTIDVEASALELLDVVADADWDRTGDDVVVVDRRGRCLGVVQVTEVVRGVAEAKVEEATALSPLTRLPGTDTVARDIDRRIAAREPFVTAWLDVDSFKAVNDNAGFAAGDDLIRELGRALTEVAARLHRVTVSHVGGDDFLVACDVDEIATLAAAMLDTSWSADGHPVSVSLATLVCMTSSVSSYRDVSKLLAPLKKRAKQVRGSSWVLGRPGSDRVEVLRGRGGRPGSGVSRPA